MTARIGGTGREPDGKPYVMIVAVRLETVDGQISSPTSLPVPLIVHEGDSVEIKQIIADITFQDGNKS